MIVFSNITNSVCFQQPLFTLVSVLSVMSTRLHFTLKFPAAMFVGRQGLPAVDHCPLDSMAFHLFRGSVMGMIFLFRFLLSLV